MSTQTAQPIQAIVIGGSAGAIDALSAILPRLPADFPIPVVVVVHVSGHRPSLLAQVIGQQCRVTVCDAEDKAPLEPATVYMAPAGYHLLIERRHTLALSVDEPVNFSRPAIDVLFESAADAFGPRLAAVLLTGASEDGARGLARVGAAGGLTIVQSPATASSPTMPEAGVRLARPDHVLPLDQLGSFLARLDVRAAATTEPS
jgi:two-component system chemotaxis response regulator CheB